MRKRVRIGEMRDRLRMRRKSDVPDALAATTTPEFADECDIWARVLPITGTELRDGDQVDDGATHEIATRYMKSLTSSFEFVDGDGIVYRVKTITHDQRRTFTFADCEQLQGAA